MPNAKPKGRFVYSRIAFRRAKAAYQVAVENPAGELGPVVGTIVQKWFPHIERHGWEATASDGHRGVHGKAWQAAKALVIDLTNYPFPIINGDP